MWSVHVRVVLMKSQSTQEGVWPSANKCTLLYKDSLVVSRMMNLIFVFWKNQHKTKYIPDVLLEEGTMCVYWQALYTL